MPRMRFDRSEIYKGQQGAGGGVDAIIKLPALLICKSRCLDECGGAVEVLLKKHRRFDAAWIALQNRRPFLEKGHVVIGGRQIVTDQIEFREFFVGPIDTVQTRN